jgi:vacuolar-type H+-ATPase subunit H
MMMDKNTNLDNGEITMRVDDLILELQDMVNNAKPMPLSKDRKVLISGDRIFDILEEIEDSLPSEIRQAKGVVADREQIISTAQTKADEIIRQAEERRKIMVSQSEITRAAEAQAKDILKDAKRKSDEMHKAANDYVNGLMERTDEAVSKFANEIKQTRKNFKSSAK